MPIFFLLHFSCTLNVKTNAISINSTGMPEDWPPVKSISYWHPHISYNCSNLSDRGELDDYYTSMQSILLANTVRVYAPLFILIGLVFTWYRTLLQQGLKIARVCFTSKFYSQQNPFWSSASINLQELGVHSLDRHPRSNVTLINRLVVNTLIKSPRTYRL